jgi:hypothetical protein
MDRIEKIERLIAPAMKLAVARGLLAGGNVDEKTYARHWSAMEALVDSIRAPLLAELDECRAALKAIDRHVVGACESAFVGMPEPCEECGEMREIAAQALKAIEGGA